MRHFSQLTDEAHAQLFFKVPAEFERDSDRALLATALGGTLYSPSIRSDLAGDAVKLAANGLRSLVLCLEDSIPDDRVAEGEANLVRTLSTLNNPVYKGRLPLLFIRIRTPEHLVRVAEQNHDNLDVLTGFVLPKFEDVTGTASHYMQVLRDINQQREAAGQRPMLFMPVLESPLMAHRETREIALLGIKNALASAREYLLAVRIGATDLSSVYGLRRNPDLTIYDVHVIASMIGDIVNLFGRASEETYTISGAVWEHFSTHDRLLKPQLRESPFDQDRALRRRLLTAGFDSLIKEILFDKSNGITGKTIIHPSHVNLVHAMLVVTHEEYSDAQHILAADNAAGGAKASVYRNKMNEVKPHLPWAQRTLLRAAAFGVANEGIDFVDFLEAAQ